MFLWRHRIDFFQVTHLRKGSSGEGEKDFVASWKLVNSCKAAPERSQSPRRFLFSNLPAIPTS